jgi:hypothetical protein
VVAEETLTQFEKSAARSNHHLIYIVGRVGEDGADLSFEVHGDFQK